jgi:hypothetical protein
MTQTERGSRRRPSVHGGPEFRIAYKTARGVMYRGRAEQVLESVGRGNRGSTQLILTSPPFPLNRKKRRLNREENLRPIPPGDPEFAPLYKRRADAESIHRSIEDSLFLNRAHSVGHARQELNLLGYAILVNSLSLAHHRKRQKLRESA